MDREPYLPKRLYRSRTDRMIAGVAGGLARYFDVDPVLVRLIWAVAAVLSGGMAVAVYFILMIVVPEADRYEEPRANGSSRAARDRASTVRENLDDLQTEFRRLAEDVEATFRPHPKSSATAPTAAEPTAETGPADPITGTAEPVERPYHEPVYAWGEARRRRRMWAGVLLIGLGLVFLLNNLNLLWWFNLKQLWPLVLIGIGALLLWNRMR